MDGSLFWNKNNAVIEYPLDDSANVSTPIIGSQDSVLIDNADSPPVFYSANGTAFFAFLRRLPVAGIDYIELAKFSADDDTETVVKSGGPFNTMSAESDIYINANSYYLLGGAATI